MRFFLKYFPLPELTPTIIFTFTLVFEKTKPVQAKFKIVIMKTLTLIISLLLLTIAARTQPKVKWDENYSFDKCNNFKIEFYAKNNELMRTDICKTFYQSGGENMLFRWVTQSGNRNEILVDKKYEIGLQMYSVETPNAMYNAGGYKYPAAEDLKRLDLVPTSETKQIAGTTCKKFTYTFKKIFGEVWMTDEIKLSNDLGVFRACKMAAKHNTLSENGFVMEMTTEDSGGGRTLMTTISLQENENYELGLTGKNISVAINKISYYLFP